MCVCVRGCVCVWNVWIDVKLSSFLKSSWNFHSTMQGAAGHVIVLQPTKTAMTFCDIDPGRWIDVPALWFFFIMAGLSREPYQPILYGCRNLMVISFPVILDRILSPSVQHSELGMAALWKPLGRAVFYFRTFYMVIPMDTSSRTPLDHYFLWFCMNGIQFPTDHFVDPFQSSVCACACACAHISTIDIDIIDII